MNPHDFLVLLIAVACTSFVAYGWGRMQGRRDRVERMPWHVEQGVDVDWRAGERLVVQVVRAQTALNIAVVDIRHDDWEKRFTEAVERAEDRAAGLNAHLEELPR